MKAKMLPRRGKKPNKNRISIHHCQLTLDYREALFEERAKVEGYMSNEAMTSLMLSVSASIAYRECQAADKRGLIKAASGAAHRHLTSDSETPEKYYLSAE